MGIWTTLLFPSGAVVDYAAAAAPSGWLLCDGTSYLRADYADLFAVIGTTYGSADGTHFNVPDCKGKVTVGFNSGETEFDALAETGGAKTVTLTSAQSGVPAHTHAPSSKQFALTDAIAQVASGVNSGAVNAASSVTAANAAADAASGHNNLQPYITMNKIIKT